MRIWVLRDGEPLPIDPGGRRLMRDGMLCQTLAERGHDVVFWTSSFDHYAHRQRASRTERHQVLPNYKIVLVHGPGYRRNISPQRIAHNLIVTAGIERLAKTESRPDVLVTDIPTTETAAAVVRLGQQWGVPTMVSVRDLWPDFFETFAPAPLRPLVRLATKLFDDQARFALGGATSVVGVSPGYLRWGLSKAGRTQRLQDAVIPLGYARPATLTPERRAEVLGKLNIPTGKRLVTFAGSWGRTYDLQLVLEAARRLVDRPDVLFVLAGSGAQDHALRQRISGAPNIVAPGWLNAEGIDALLSASQVGLLPYRQGAPQGLPNKIYEYMCYGLAQVSNLPGEAQTFLAEHNAGISAEAAGADAFATAINEALQLAEAPGFAAGMQAIFSEHYSQPVVYGRYADLVEQLAATPVALRR